MDSLAVRERLSPETDLGAGHSELLRGGEVAGLLNISRALAYRWMQAGVLPVVRVGRTVRVPRSACLRWIEQNTQQPAGDWKRKRPAGQQPARA
jgi:excisionase family DNA binding protein